MKYPLVEIVWTDTAFMDAGLVYPDEIDWIVPQCKLAGYLVKETPEFYVIAKEVWDTGQSKYHHIILKKMIPKIIFIKSSKGK